MSAQGIRAGKAFVELGADDSKLMNGLRAAQEKLHQFGNKLAGLGSTLKSAGDAVIAPMRGALDFFAASGDELSKAADKTGASIESLSELRHAAAQSAVEFKQLTTAMNKQQRGLAEAASGNKTATEWFDNLGLSVDRLLELSPDEQFTAIAEKISQIEDPAKRTAAAMEVFGKSGAELMPLMIGGAEGIEMLRKEARDLGLQVSGEDAANATLFGDTLANLQDTFKQTAFVVGAAIAPAVTNAMQSIIPMVAFVVKWTSENRQLIFTVAAIAAGITGAGVLLIGLGAGFSLAATAVGGLITVLGTVSALIGAVISPVGILTGLIIGLGYAFFAWTDAGQQTATWFSSEFGKLLTIVTDTVGGIYNAIKGGRLDLAAQIAFTGVKLAIATVMESVLGIFGSSIDDMMGMLAAVIKRIGELIAKVNQARVGVTNWISEGIGKLFLNEQEQRILGEDNARRSEGAQQWVDDWKGWDSGYAGKGWAEFFNTDDLREQLDQLNQAASEAAAAVETSNLEIDEFKRKVANIGEYTGSGLDQSAKRNVLGTFSAAEAVMGGISGDLQKQQLETQKRIERNTRGKVSLKIT